MPKLNQKGVIHLIPLLLILIGIGVGVYLVQHPQVFKPKAYEADLPLIEADNPPPLLVTHDSAYSTLGNVFQASDYNFDHSESEEEITLNLEPAQMTEAESKLVLKSMDPYYPRMLSWVLLDTTNYFKRPPIDPWYAFCDHLDTAVLNKMGAEWTYLTDGRVLECSDPPPSQDQINITDPHYRYTYKKIPAKELLRTLQWAAMQRENAENPNNDAKSFAASAVPVFGPIIEYWFNPPPVGTDPTEISNRLFTVAVITSVDFFTLGTAGGIKAGVKTAGKVAHVVSSGPASFMAKELSKHMSNIVLRAGKKGFDYALAVVERNGLKETVFLSSQLSLEQLEGVKVLALKLVNGAKYADIAATGVSKYTAGRFRSAFQRRTSEDLLRLVQLRGLDEVRLPGSQDSEVVVVYFPNSINERENIVQNGLYKTIGEDALTFYKTPAYEEKLSANSIPPVLFLVSRNWVGYSTQDNFYTDSGQKYFMGVLPDIPGLALYQKVLLDEENKQTLESFPDPENVGWLPPEFLVEDSRGADSNE